MDTIGKRIKFIRKEKGFTQDTLGEFLNISKQNISNYENDLAKPNYDFLCLLNKKFRVNLNWLIVQDGDPFLPPPFEQVQDELTQKVEALLRKHKLIE